MDGDRWELIKEPCPVGSDCKKLETNHNTKYSHPGDAAFDINPVGKKAGVWLRSPSAQKFFGGNLSAADYKLLGRCVFYGSNGKCENRFSATKRCNWMHEDFPCFRFYATKDSCSDPDRCPARHLPTLQVHRAILLKANQLVQKKQMQVNKQMSARYTIGEQTSALLAGLCPRYADKWDCQAKNCTFLHQEYPCEYFYALGGCRAGPDCQFWHGPYPNQHQLIIIGRLKERVQMNKAPGFQLPNSPRSKLPFPERINLQRSPKPKPDKGDRRTTLPYLCDSDGNLIPSPNSTKSLQFWNQTSLARHRPTAPDTHRKNPSPTSSRTLFPDLSENEQSVSTSFWDQDSESSNSDSVGKSESVLAPELPHSSRFNVEFYGVPADVEGYDAHGSKRKPDNPGNMERYPPGNYSQSPSNAGIPVPGDKCIGSGAPTSIGPRIGEPINIDVDLDVPDSDTKSFGTPMVENVRYGATTASSIAFGAPSAACACSSAPTVNEISFRSPNTKSARCSAPYSNLISRCGAPNVACATFPTQTAHAVRFCPPIAVSTRCSSTPSCARFSGGPNVGSARFATPTNIDVRFRAPKAPSVQFISPNKRFIQDEAPNVSPARNKVPHSDDIYFGTLKAASALVHSSNSVDVRLEAPEKTASARTPVGRGALRRAQANISIGVPLHSDPKRSDLINKSGSGAKRKKKIQPVPPSISDLNPKPNPLSPAELADRERRRKRYSRTLNAISSRKRSFASTLHNDLPALLDMNLNRIARMSKKSDYGCFDKSLLLPRVAKHPAGRSVENFVKHAAAAKNLFKNNYSEVSMNTHSAQKAESLVVSNRTKSPVKVDVGSFEDIVPTLCLYANAKSKKITGTKLDKTTFAQKFIWRELKRVFGFTRRDYLSGHLVKNFRLYSYPSWKNINILGELRNKQFASDFVDTFVAQLHQVHLKFAHSRLQLADSRQSEVGDTTDQLICHFSEKKCLQRLRKRCRTIIKQQLQLAHNRHSSGVGSIVDDLDVILKARCETENVTASFDKNRHALSNYNIDVPTTVKVIVHAQLIDAAQFDDGHSTSMEGNRANETPLICQNLTNFHPLVCKPKMVLIRDDSTASMDDSHDQASLAEIYNPNVSDISMSSDGDHMERGGANDVSPSPRSQDRTHVNPEFFSLPFSASVVDSYFLPNLTSLDSQLSPMEWLPGTTETNLQPHQLVSHSSAVSSGCSNSRMHEMHESFMESNSFRLIRIDNNTCPTSGCIAKPELCGSETLPVISRDISSSISSFDLPEIGVSSTSLVLPATGTVKHEALKAEPFEVSLSATSKDPVMSEAIAALAMLSDDEEDEEEKDNGTISGITGFQNMKTEVPAIDRGTFGYHASGGIHGSECSSRISNEVHSVVSSGDQEGGSCSAASSNNCDIARLCHILDELQSASLSPALSSADRNQLMRRLDAATQKLQDAKTLITNVSP